LSVFAVENHARRSPKATNQPHFIAPVDRPDIPLWSRGNPSEPRRGETDHQFLAVDEMKNGEQQTGNPQFPRKLHTPSLIPNSPRPPDQILLYYGQSGGSSARPTTYVLLGAGIPHSALIGNSYK